MILPLIGFIGKPRYSIGGLSTKGGFQLLIKNLPKNDYRIFISSHCNDKNSIPMENTIITCLFPPIAAMLAVILACLNYAIYYNPDMLTYEKYLLYFVSCVAIPVVGFKLLKDLLRYAYSSLVIFFDKDWREWHACEHKSVILITASIEPTIENLKKMPVTLTNCGVLIKGVDLEILTFVFLSFFACSLPNLEEFIIPLIPLYFFISISFSCCIYTLTNMATDLFDYATAIIALPIMAIPLLVEKFMALKEPSDEKLAQTAAELKEFINTDPFFFDKETPA